MNMNEYITFMFLKDVREPLHSFKNITEVMKFNL